MDLITVRRKGGRQYAVRVRGHDLTLDLPEREGGRDAGPSPVELLAGSLGTCIAMTVQGYCDRHGYTDGDVGVNLTLELADGPKRVARFVVDLELPAGVPEGKMKAIRRVAERCPVHETLRIPPSVDLDFT
jgi:uncharacterized OsmC-like protein